MVKITFAYKNFLRSIVLILMTDYGVWCAHLGTYQI